MNRTALICAVLFATASTFLCLFGLSAVFILGLCLCLASAGCLIAGRRLGVTFKISAVLLVGAAFCLYLYIFNFFTVGRIEQLDGQTHTVCCRVVEEPRDYSSSVRVLVETDGNNGFDGKAFGKVRFYLFIGSEESAAKAVEGDILSATVEFESIARSYKTRSFAERVFISAEGSDIEIIGHKESLYTRCIDIRRAVRRCIREYTSGDSAALLDGILLGGTAYLSPETYSAFKACGVTHITAVSGMHISAFCMMLAYLLRYVMSRRAASLIAVLPLILEIMLAGFTPSAVRSGIMCSIVFLGDCFLRRADGLNSLGVAVVSMLLFNPYYIGNLGFQLSCAAAAGVILVSPYGATLSDRVISFEKKFISGFLRGIVLSAVQTVGATIFTLPFQIISFGFVSTVFLPANLLICGASVVAMALTVAGAVLHFIPIFNYLAVIPFTVADWLAKYMVAAVRLLAEIPFSYIPFGNSAVVLWCGASLFAVAVWLLFNRLGGIKLISLSVIGLLLVSLWSEYIFSKDLAAVTLLEGENGFCSVVTYEKTCVIIGCGSGTNYALTDYMYENGIAETELLLVLSDETDSFGGYSFVKDNSEPETTVIPESFGNSTVFSGELKIASNGESFATDDGNIIATAHIYKGGCVYELLIAGRRLLISDSRFSAEDIGIREADVIVCGSSPPSDIKSEITLVLNEYGQGVKSISQKRVITVYSESYTVKFKKGKGMSVYAG